MHPDDPTITQPVMHGGEVLRRAGKYRVVGRIGQGGMGVVYRAVDDDLGRTVALKFLPPRQQGSNAAIEQRFLREARAASALDHVNIGTIYGVEETEDHQRFIVMAYYEGRTLRDRMMDPLNPIKRDEALSIGRQIAAGLDEAHARGIVHRDIKPSNILITTQGTVKIVDFGLASISGAEQLTASGAFVGTPGYMSPEQVEGLEADKRADIWALGVIVLEMLTGERAFPGDSIPSIVYKVAQGQVSGLDKVEEPLRSIVGKALARDTGRRYQSAGEFVAALERGENVASVTPGVARRPRFPMRWTGVVAALFLTTVLAVGWWRWNAGNNGPATGSEAYGQAVELTRRWDRPGNLERAVALLEALIKQDPKFALGYARLADAQRIQSVLTRDEALMESAAKNAREAVRLAPELAPGHVVMGRILSARGNNDLALAAYGRALKIDPNDAEAHQAIARQYERLGRIQDAEAAYKKALAFEPDNISIHDSYGSFLFRQSRFGDAAREWETVTRAAPDHAAALVNLGSALSEDSKYVDASKALEASVRIKPNAMAYGNLGTVYSRTARYADAAEAYKKAIELDDKEALFWGNLGYVYSWMSGMDDLSMKAFRKAIGLAEMKRSQSPRDAALHRNLALYYAKTKNTGLALQRLNTAIALAPKVAETQAAAAEVYELTGDHAQAVDCVKNAINLGMSRQRLQANREISRLLAALPGGK